MSNDQKPERVRAVAGVVAGVSAPGGAADSGTEAKDGGPGAVALPPASPEQSAAGGPSLAAIFLFLLGCGAGGAAIAAMPYFVGAQ